jgi:uncharacterized protein YegJ (DUF2314 family)
VAAFFMSFSLFNLPNMSASILHLFMHYHYFVAALLLLGGCQSGSTDAKIERQGEPTIYNVKGDDPEMDAAIHLSKATFPEFLQVFEKQDTATSDFAIKVHYDDGSEAEHLWLAALSLRGPKLYGVVSNVPEFTKQVKEGEQVEVDTSKVSDWKYVQNHRLVGGRTIKVLRNRLSPAEKAELDKSVDYQIE